jgi:hypothetical protein
MWDASSIRLRKLFSCSKNILWINRKHNFMEQLHFQQSTQVWLDGNGCQYQTQCLHAALVLAGGCNYNRTPGHRYTATCFALAAADNRLQMSSATPVV